MRPVTHRAGRSEELAASLDRVRIRHERVFLLGRFRFLCGEVDGRQHNEEEPREMSTEN
jgi:hypothetical protein